MRQFQAVGCMENIRLKVLAGFMAGESASHLSKAHSLPLEQVLEWKRLTTYGHTDWTEGTKRQYSIEEKRLIYKGIFPNLWVVNTLLP